MKQTTLILKSLLGDDGFDALQKAIYKKGTQSVLDPLEFLLPLIVVPRAILSWLAQTIKPMKVGEHKTVDFPGKSDIKMWVQKQDIDVYRGEFIKDNKVVQSFDKLCLPAVAASAMTTGEMYGSDDSIISDRQEMIDEHEKLVQVLKSPSHEDDLKEAKKQQKELDEYKKNEPTDMIGWMIKHSGVGAEIPKEIPKLSGSQLASVTEKVGRLLDILISQKLKKAVPQMPSGAGIAQKPKIPKMPVSPSPTANPSAQSTKQAQTNSMAAPNPTHASSQPLKLKQQKGLAVPPMAPKSPMPKMGGAKPTGSYFRKKLQSGIPAVTTKSESFTIPEQDLYRPCQHCGTPEFVKGEDGKPHFKPCACFMVEKQDRFGKPDFVSIKKNESGSYELAFCKDADPESVQAFLLTLKAKLLVSKKLDRYGK